MNALMSPLQQRSIDLNPPELFHPAKRDTPLPHRGRGGRGAGGEGGDLSSETFRSNQLRRLITGRQSVRFSATVVGRVAAATGPPGGDAQGL